MQGQSTVPLVTKEQQDQEPDFDRAGISKFNNSASDPLQGKYNFEFLMSFFAFGKLTFSPYNLER